MLISLSDVTLTADIVALRALLDNVRAALAAFSERKLLGPTAGPAIALQTSPGFLAWIEHAADWELHRGRGRDFNMRPPNAALAPAGGSWCRGGHS